MHPSFAHARLRSFRYALAGIAHLLKTQPNARLHLLATALVIAAGIYFRLAPPEWCWLIAAMGTVWVAEAFNTAVEMLADATCPEWHPLIGRAKDVAAGAVLLAACGATGIGVCVFGGRVW